MADIYDKILIFLCSGGYKNLKFVENGVVLRRLNKLNSMFNLEKKRLIFETKIPKFVPIFLILGYLKY